MFAVTRLAKTGRDGEMKKAGIAFVSTVLPALCFQRSRTRRGEKQKSVVTLFIHSCEEAGGSERDCSDEEGNRAQASLPLSIVAMVVEGW